MNKFKVKSLLSHCFLPQTQEEIAQTMATLTPPKDVQRALSPFAEASGVDIPDTLDLRDKGLVTSVKMQVKTTHPQ